MSQLTPEVIQQLTPKQRATLDRLEELAQTQVETRETVEKSFEAGGYSEDGGKTVTFYDSWESFELINAGKPPENQHPLYRTLKAYEKEMKELTQEAVDNGLGYLAIIQTLYEKHGIKIK